MKRKYSNKFANKEQQNIKPVRKNSKALRRMTQMIAVAACISAFCGGGYISDREKGGAE